MEANSTRLERDALGERSLSADALHGIHTLRALENFPLSDRPVRPELVHAYGAVKLAATSTNRELAHLAPEVAEPLERACREMMTGALDAHVVVDPLQGGAGTSLHMNVNEVLANRALVLRGLEPGRHDVISPIAHANLHQSTNDTFPTALRVAAIASARRLERELAATVISFQEKERAFARIVKVGRTQLQDAVLTTLGRTMGAFAEAFARDRWRVEKCEERLRVVNLGGTAIGTGLGAPRDYIFTVVDMLRTVTGFPLSRAENLLEATQNQDALVEVSGLLKTCASNLLKISTDLRLLSAGPSGGFRELELPRRQAGSSIMPGKVNPVILEAASQVAISVCANDVAITHAVSLGNLELHAFLPLVADRLLESLVLLTRALSGLRTLCIDGLRADEERCRQHVEGSVAVATALVPLLGYELAGTLAREAEERGMAFVDVAVERGALTREEYEAATRPAAIQRLGQPKESSS